MLVLHGLLLIFGGVNNFGAQVKSKNIDIPSPSSNKGLRVHASNLVVGSPSSANSPTEFLTQSTSAGSIGSSGSTNSGPLGNGNRSWSENVGVQYADDASEEGEFHLSASFKNETDTWLGYSNSGLSQPDDNSIDSRLHNYHSLQPQRSCCYRWRKQIYCCCSLVIGAAALGAVYYTKYVVRAF